MWHASFLATVGDWHIGARTDDHHVAHQLELLLGVLLTESTNPPSGYAVVTLPRAAGIRSQPLGELRHGPQVLLRSRYPGRLAAAAAAHVIALAHASQPVLRLAFSVVARESVGVLIQPQLLRVSGLEPLLVRAGWDIVDTPEIAVTTTHELVADVIAWSPHSSDWRPDTVKLRSVVLSANEFDFRASRSAVLASLMAFSPPSVLQPQEHLDIAAQLARRLRIVSVSAARPRAVIAAVEEAL